MLGVVEFGRAWNLAQLMSDVAREGARRAYRRRHDHRDVGARLHGRETATAGVPIGAATITFSKTGAGVNGWHTDGQQTVTAGVPYSFMFFHDVFGTIPPTSSFTMRTE